MADEPNAIVDAPPFNLARLRGRTTGALVGGIFGIFWIVNGAYWGGLVGSGPLAALALCGIAFLTWPVSRLVWLRRFRASATGSQRRRNPGAAYWMVVAIECLACIGAVAWLAHIHRSDLIPQSFGVIIGLHFLPLAKIFTMPIYYATGVVMALGALASLVIPVGDARNLAACGAIGLCLWGTSAVNLWQDRAAFRKPTV